MHRQLLHSILSLCPCRQRMSCTDMDLRNMHSILSPFLWIGIITQFAKLSIPSKNTRPLDTHELAKERYH